MCGWRQEKRERACAQVCGWFKENEGRDGHYGRQKEQGRLLWPPTLAQNLCYERTRISGWSRGYKNW